MKKIIAFTCTFMLLFVMLLPASAANNVSQIDYDVVLLDDGSAYITQVWQGVFDEKTENYIPINKSGYLEITDFTVSDQNTVYVNRADWDIDASFEQKAGKCGVIDYGDSYELCWGITNYGQNTYTIKYKVKDMVGSYAESDGFNFRFINDNMSTFPTNVNLTIRLENGESINDDNCNIWGFGYNGQIVFENQAIHAYSTSPLEGDANMTIMTEFEKGVIHPQRQAKKSFENVIEQAKQGSDYDDDDEDWTFLKIGAIIAGIVIILSVISSIIRKRQIDKFEKQADYYRDNPNYSNLNATYKLGMLYDRCEKQNIIGAVMLRLINTGCIEPATGEIIGFMGSVRKRIDLKIVKSPAPGNEYDEHLYNLLRAAAGSDGILQEKEFEKYCTVHPDKLQTFIDKCEISGLRVLNDHNCFIGMGNTRIKHLSDEGRIQLLQLMGLKNYLEDFTLLNERGIEEIALWQTYMMYALLLGIAEKLIKEMKKVYPQYIPQIEQTFEQSVVLAYHYRTVSYSAMTAAQHAQQARSSGGGGMSSFGGGGGFSGGGSGGGSR